MKRTSFENGFLCASGIISLAALVLCTAAGIARRDYWSYVIYEKSPFGLYEIFLLFMCFCLAAYNLFLIFKKERGINVYWAVLSIGFFYLTLDETFAIHENLRESFFKAKNIGLNVFFWTEKGDYALLLLMATGLSMLPFLFKELKKDARGFRLFLMAVFFSAAAVMTDSVNLSAFGFGVQKFLQYAEEIFETAGSLFFMNSFFAFALKQAQK